jgi:hypothetical protein
MGFLSVVASSSAAHRAGAEQRHAVVGDPHTRTQR